jgi:hypothetical protein
MVLYESGFLVELSMSSHEADINHRHLKSFVTVHNLKFVAVQLVGDQSHKNSFFQAMIEDRQSDAILANLTGNIHTSLHLCF